MTDVTTDCRSEVGITVGLIDTMINSARLLKHRDMLPAAVQEALHDLRHDEDVDSLFKSKTPEYPVVHRNPNVQGLVIQYDSNVFIWHTLPTETRKAEQRVTNSLAKAWAHRASHLRVVKGVI